MDYSIGPVDLFTPTNWIYGSTSELRNNYLWELQHVLGCIYNFSEVTVDNETDFQCPYAAGALEKLVLLTSDKLIPYKSDMLPRHHEFTAFQDTQIASLFSPQNLR